MQKIVTGLALLIVLAFTGMRDRLEFKKAQKLLYLNAEKENDTTLINDTVSANQTH